ncbi:magnesium transporter [Rickettsiales endosymbiont of Peranema trichophorum]|uniref:magnesium transporter CorA family protein n=1 Tax=Rickettsiales endosymbiont of Peranema trichophorum TaxID=2486577 RepID=UPI0010239921|nr:magnesium transporter CorA family protein [Rickettsiales endosymbiont of Peranema trichophorum]RZI47773.1 magnesium transporter [Rickettsiales endosymbiont of Peranema trichophorum]
MIVAFINSQNALTKEELKPGDKIPNGLVWVDLFEPTASEEKYIEKVLNIETLTKEEMDKIEVSSPFYKEGDAYYMTITVLHRSDLEYPDSTAITFILTPTCLVTLRYSRPRAFNNFASKAIKNPELCATPELAFEGTIESIVNKVAGTLEKSGNDLDMILKKLFEKSSDNGDGYGSYSTNYHDIIKEVGRTGNVISKNRESLQSINRMLIFYGQMEASKSSGKREYKPWFRTISRELLSLTEYAHFLSQRVSFMLDAALGMVSVEQNSIIKVFTIAAAGFMPPTLIASIYGMNFKHMPEVNWEMGYPFAICMIVISALFPYFLFKRKGWI